MYTVYDSQGNVITTTEKDSTFATFRDLDLSNADFRNAKLTFAKFIRCNVDGADFRGADMRASYMERTDFRTAITDKTTKMPEPEEHKYHFM